MAEWLKTIFSLGNFCDHEADEINDPHPDFPFLQIKPCCVINSIGQPLAFWFLHSEEAKATKSHVGHFMSKSRKQH